MPKPNDFTSEDKKFQNKETDFSIVSTVGSEWDVK